MIINDENRVDASLSSESFKSTHNKSTIIKENIQTKPEYYSKINSKILNLNYNKSNIQKFNEKAKNSEKKTIRNNR